MNIKFMDENLLGQPGLCPYITPETNWQRDISDYDACIYTDRFCFNQPIDNTKQNYAWIIEPPIINGENYRDIVEASNKYKFVFSYLRNLETKINNYKYIPHGGTWLRSDDINIYSKTKLLSFLFSDKQWNPYHRLRHRIYEMIKVYPNIDFFGSGCNNKIQYKIDSLKIDNVFLDRINIHVIYLISLNASCPLLCTKITALLCMAVSYVRCGSAQYPYMSILYFLQPYRVTNIEYTL